jgi:hypothetical protein
MGLVHEVPLVVGGEDMPVTDANKAAYVDHLVALYCTWGCSSSHHARQQAPPTPAAAAAAAAAVAVAGGAASSAAGGTAGSAAQTDDSGAASGAPTDAAAAVVQQEQQEGQAWRSSAGSLGVAADRAAGAPAGAPAPTGPLTDTFDVVSSDEQLQRPPLPPGCALKDLPMPVHASNDN